MNNLFDFLSRYYHWFLFALLEVISMVLLFQYNSYHGSLWISSANEVAGRVYDADARIEQYFSLAGANEKLTQRNLILEQQVQTLTDELNRQRDDSTLMRSATVKMLSNYHLIPAKVVSNSITELDNLITIDKGEADGVYPDMGVASGNGVVGIVYQSGAHYSIVIPLLSSRSSISCTIAKRGYFGYLKWLGKDSRHAYLDDVPRHAHFRLYDKVVTSGYSSVFPPGMEVGKIIHVYNSPDGVSYRCMVELSVDFSRLRDVCVIDDAAMRERLELLHAAQDSLSNDN